MKEEKIEFSIIFLVISLIRYIKFAYDHFKTRDEFDVNFIR